MSGLTKRAPFDVRFDFHYNYKMSGLSKRAPFDVRFDFQYKRRILQWSKGLDKTGTIWCPFCFTLQLQK